MTNQTNVYTPSTQCWKPVNLFYDFMYFATNRLRNTPLLKNFRDMKADIGINVIISEF